MGFTHVGTVENGKLSLEERAVEDNDWNLFEGASATISKDGMAKKDQQTNGEDSTAPKEIKADAIIQKRMFNAPKRIAKIETLIQENERQIAALDKEMMAHGQNVSKLLELTEKKAALEAKEQELMEEWEELEELLASTS